MVQNIDKYAAIAVILVTGNQLETGFTHMIVLVFQPISR